MFKKMFLVLSLLSFGLEAQSLSLNYVFPKSASLVYFTFSLAQAFEKDKNDTSYIKMVSDVKYKKYLNDLSFTPIRDLGLSPLDNPITLCGIDSKYNPIKNSADLFLFASFYSPDIVDLKKNAAPLFAALVAKDAKNKDLEAKIYAILNDWSGSHESLIWLASTDKTKLQLTKTFQDRAKTLNLDTIIQKMNVFTQKPWPVSVPFTVAFTPIPETSESGVGGRTYSTALHIPIKMSLALSNKDAYIDAKVGIIAHEIFHSLLGILLNPNTDDLKKKKEEIDKTIRAYYEKNTTITAEKFNDDLSEVLATAIGNGYVASRGDTKVRWHGYTGVDGAAKAIYKTLFEYLDSGKPIDAAFIQKFIDIRAIYRTTSYSW